MDHLLGPLSRGDTAQLRADAAAYGVILEAHHLEPPSYRLWAEHGPVVELLARCLTQWRTGPRGLVGLDYGAVLELARLYEVPDMRQALEWLQIMELHARDLLNRKISKSHGNS